MTHQCAGPSDWSVLRKTRHTLQLQPKIRPGCSSGVLSLKNGLSSVGMSYGTFNFFYEGCVEQMMSFVDLLLSTVQFVVSGALVMDYLLL